VVQHPELNLRTLADVELVDGTTDLKQPQEVIRAVERTNLARGRNDHRRLIGQANGSDAIPFSAEAGQFRIPLQIANHRRRLRRSDDDGWQLRSMPQEWARTNLGGVVGVRLIKELNGTSCIPMKDPLETKKMIATTRMFGKPVFELNDIREAVATYTSRAAEKLRRQACAANKLQVFVVTNGNRNAKYEYNPQSRYQYSNFEKATSDTDELIGYALPLVDKLYQPGVKYLKAGVILGDLVPSTVIQSNLFLAADVAKKQELMKAIDNINFSQRDDIVKYVASGIQRNWKMRQELRSNRFTTRWDELYEIQ